MSQMVDDKTKMAIALKRFSVISPILNGQVKSITAYCAEVTEQPIEMPHYGLRTYSPNTISNWYSDYARMGIDGLKPQSRSDIGKTRVLTPEMSDKVLEKITQYPKAPATLIYDMLIEERAFLKSEVSLATVRRFIRANEPAIDTEPGNAKQMLRFAREHVNEVWQTDCLYGPFVMSAKGKQHTYLLAYLDDCSRLIAHAQFYQSQDLAVLRHSFREAVLRRGSPKILYTDNGKIYRSQSFAYLCANIGVALIHHGIGMAHQKGKIERFFKTVRSNFLSRVTAENLQSLEKLNEAFWLWLDDYHKKPHSGLNGQSPLECFLQQAASVKLPTDLADFNTKFLVKVSRTVKKDATISLNSQIYETNPALAGIKLDVKYDPDTSPGIIPELFLFQGDKPVGLARLVNFQENSYRKRGGQKKTANIEPEPATGIIGNTQAGMKSHTISYAQMQRGE
jgi:transposase InsO family protein